MRILVYLLCLTSLAGADVSVIIRTDPPGAHIFPVRRGALAGQAAPEVGVTNGPPVVLRYPPGQTSITLELRHDLCQPETVTIDNLTTLESGLSDSWPAQGSVPLKYKSSLHRALGFVRSWSVPLLLLGGALGLLVTGVVFRALRTQRKARQIERHARTITDLVVPTAGDDPLLGRNFDNYLLVERLGKGGMATVYRALPQDRLRDESEAVAIKVLDPELGRDEDFVKRFEREKNVYGELVHPNIVRVYGYGSYQDHYYLVLELIDGSTLRSVMPEGFALTPAKALQHLTPLMQALAFAHRKGIVHRDLKPENVMVTRKGQLKVMDFGMARGQHNHTVTATGALLGTPTYMAPEQIQGKLDTRTDQYAVGVMLYEMLAGHPPFEEENAVTLLMRHLQDAPPPLKLPGPRAQTEPILEVVAKMLAKDPEARYADLDEALQALEWAVKGR